MENKYTTKILFNNFITTNNVVKRAEHVTVTKYNFPILIPSFNYMVSPQLIISVNLIEYTFTNIQIENLKRKEPKNHNFEKNIRKQNKKEGTPVVNNSRK